MKQLARMPIIAVLFASLGVVQQTIASEDPEWQDIRPVLFQERDIQPAPESAMVLYAPSDAQEAALVPISINMPTETAVNAKSLTLVIDRNPVPVAAEIEFGQAFKKNHAVGDRILATRIRLDSFSKVRAILELADGQLLMATRYIVGSGGCSATPSKDSEAALANLGQMRINENAAIEARGQHWREAIIKVRHPNFTGMQMNPKTGEYTPARYVRELSVMRGAELLFRMEGGISISENPYFRVTYSVDEPDKPLNVVAQDTEGAKFSATSKPTDNGRI